VNRTIRRGCGIAVATLLGLALVGCGSDGDSKGSTDDGADSTDTTIAPEDQEAGGTLTYLWPAETADLLPETSSGFEVAVGSAERFAIYDALVVEVPPEGELEMRLAESIEPNDDATVWTVALRPDVTFSDGTPFDADAVRQAFERVADPERNSPSAPIAQTMTNIEVVDDTTLEVTLDAPNAMLDRQLAESAMNFVGSPTALEELGDDGFASAPVGAGPYTVSEWQRDSQIVLERNPDYYGETFLDEIVIQRIGDEAQRLNTLTTGGAQLSFTVDPTTASQAADGGFGDTMVSLSGGFALQYNLDREPFDDIRAREAIALAFDAEDLNETVFAGGADVASAILRDDSPDNTGIEQVSPDHDEAQALFDELAEEGTPVEVTISTSPSQLAAAEWFITTLASYDNVTAELSDSATAQLIDDVRAGNYELLFTNYGFYDLGLGLNNVVRTGGGDNTGGYSNPDVDAAFAEALASTSPEARADAYATIEQAVVDDLPLFFTTRLVTHLLTAPEVKGMATVSNGIPDWTHISLG